MGFSQDYIQEFFTGGDADSYRVTHVDLEMRSTASTPPTYTVTIWRTQTNQLTTEVGTLTPSTSLPASFGTVQFTPTDDIDLSPHRSYAIVVDVSAGDDTTALRTTGASAEDAGGGAGWRIRDDARWRKNSALVWVLGGRAAKIAIHGYARDTTAPELLGGTIRGDSGAGTSTVKLYFSEDLDTTQTPDENAFTVTGGSTTLGTVSSATFDTNEDKEFNIIELTVANAANNSETASIAIAATAGIQDAAGNALAQVTGFELTNIGANDPGAPALRNEEGAVVLHDTLTLTYNQRLLPRFPPLSDFTVSVNGTEDRAVTDLAITRDTSSSTVVLTLSTPVQHGDRVLLSYSRKLKPKLQNEWGIQASPFTNHGVSPLSCATTDPAVSEVNNGGQALAEDCTVLLWLRDTLVGTGRPLDWETETRMDEWDGITVAGDPVRVTRLSLSSYALTGHLPASLNSLTGLTLLSLPGNHLTGEIPSLNRLTNLTDLYLDDNYLTGSIPSLAGLDKLDYLDLANNYLTGSIPSLTGLDKLRLVLLNNNQLSGPIPDLGNLAILKTLDLHNNDLSGDIPPSLSSRTTLQALNLSNNRLSGDIPDLSKLTSLRTLELSNNRLSGVPSSLRDRTSLQTLELSNNNLRGDIPDLGDLTSLRTLDLSHNAFTAEAIPDWVASLTSLTHLDLSHTNRTGTIPADLGTLTNLRQLRLHTNPLSGALPDTWGGASSLRLLDLRHTGVPSDPLPPGLQGQTNLTVWRSLPSVTLSADATHPVKASTIALVAKGTLPPVYEASGPAGTSFPAAGEVYTITALDSSNTAITTPLDAPLEVCLPLPATLPASRAYLYRYQPHATDPENQPGSWVRLTTGRRTGTENYVIDPGGIDQLWEREARVCAAVSQFSHFRVGRYASSGGGGGGGGGRGGGDDHGNSASRATRIQPGGRTAGQLNTRSDVDYFTLTTPHAGVLVVETSGATDTRATVWQAGVAVASAASGGAGQNFRLSARVEAGPVVIAVRGNGRQTGRYTLQTALVGGYLENPSPASFQSGLGLISGWVCDAEGVTIEIEKADGEVVEVAAAYGTERADTAGVCGDTANGFGVLVNWNLLDDGAHVVRVLVDGVALGVQVVPGVGVVPAVVDGIEIGRAPVTVTTLGAEFVKGLQGSLLVADFPRAGEQVRLVWQESQQNFVLAPVEGGAALTPAPSSGAIEGVLENPSPASYQSGIGVISGWVCEADEVVIEIDGQAIAAAAGTERADTLDRCGDVDNGFGLLVNWAEFGAGAHEVVALVDGVELSRATVTVTVVDATAPFVRGLAKRVELAGFPTPDETLTLEWQEAQQNFVITGVD